MLKISKGNVALALALGASVAATALADVPENMTLVTEVEGITEYRMDNGLQVLLFPDQSQETVTVNVTYHVGSKHENYGETGMAHLLEHLVFKGTPNHPNIAKELTDHGAEPNGTTWTDRTNYYETFTATPENIEWALDMEADRMVNSFIAKKDLDSEMTVVRNEFEMGENNPFGVLLTRMLATSFHWHNYGKDTIGARSDIENVPIDRLKAFYKKYYQPDNATLIVAGKINNEQILDLISEEFGAIPKPERQLPQIYTQEPVQDGERRVVVRRTGDVQFVGAMYKTPPGSHQDYAAIQVLAEILGDRKTGRLRKELVEQQLAANTFGWDFQWQEPGVMVFAAEVAKDKDISKTESVLLNTLESIGQNPITDVEVERAKAQLINQFQLGFNSSERSALELSEWVAMGDWRLLFLNRDRLEQVSQKQVQQVAEHYLVNDNRTLGVFLPEQKPERAILPQVAKVDIKKMLEGYKGREQVAQGEAFDPSHDNIDKRTIRTRLSNGAKVAFLPKKTRGESVVVQLTLDTGNLDALKGLSKVPSITNSMLMRGTQRLNREELQAEFDRLKASVSVYGGNTSTQVRIETVKANLDKVIELVGEVLKQPAFDAKELELLKREQVVQLEQQRQQPLPALFRKLSAHVNPNSKEHPFYNMTIDEEIAAIQSITEEQLKEYHQRFLGASEADVAVIGDFDREAVTDVLEQTFSGWVPKVNYERIPVVVKKVEPINESINTPDKAGAGFAAMMRFELSDEHPDYPALKLANFMFGGGFLNSRLATRLRQKDGLSYGAGSWFNASSKDQSAIFGAYAICAPENLNKVEHGFKEELERVYADGFSKQELEDAKKGFLQSTRVDRAKDKRLASTLAGQLDLERTMAWDKALEQAIEELSAEDVNRAFKKHIKLEDISIVKAGDLSKLVDEVKR